MMKKCKVFVPFGALGGGIRQEAFQNAMRLKPDIISTDAGSTDSGPYYLGTGKGKYARKAVQRDMELILTAAHEAGIPVTIGTAGTCGSDSGVDEFAEIAVEIARKHGFSMKLAKIYTEQSPEEMKSRFAAGKIHPMEGAPKISPETFDTCSHIVALAGMEPFKEALSNGADVVICGRATDTAVIAAFPLMKGCDPAATWHAAKTAECGGVCTTDVEGGVFLTIDETGFTVESPSPEGSCSAFGISAHLLYENADPVCLTEPGIVIDTSKSVYTELGDGKVRVEGTTIEYRPYTMKLEGSGPAGFQTVSIVGIQDRDVMKDPMTWIRTMQDYVQKKLDAFGLDRSRYSYSIRPYGYNAVTGTAVPKGFVPNELAIMLLVTAETQELATQVAKVFNPYLLHFPVHPERPMPSFAFPFSPIECERGQLYSFRLYHLVELDDPLELCRIVYEEV
ncbi:MAG: acyclic terpene utilization AtuA family protein [Firmicutes bacterium]|nr:acyclic terpene utilization AtuA family protein [Bacillota bacterium]